MKKIPNEFLAIDLSAPTSYIAWALYNFAQHKIEQFCSTDNITQKIITKDINTTLPYLPTSETIHNTPYKNSKKQCITHNETLIQKIELLRKQAQGNYNNLTGIIVNTGPGSFTGLRLALSFAKGLQAGLTQPIFPALSDARLNATKSIPNTLQIIGIDATHLWGEAIYHRHRPLLCLLDARSNRFYCQYFENHKKESTIEDSSIEDIYKKIVRYQKIDSKIYVTGFGGNTFLHAIEKIKDYRTILHCLEPLYTNNIDLGYYLLNLGIQKYIQNQNILEMNSSPKYIRNAVV